MVRYKEKEQNLEIAPDANLMISRLTLVTPIDKATLVNIYIRFMLGDDSKEIIESPFLKTWYIPLNNITNCLFLVFWQKKEKEVSYLDKMIGNLELKLDLLLDQQKHRVTRNVKLSSDTLSFIENLEISMDLRLWYSRTHFIANLIEDLNELINNEGMFDDYEQKVNESESNQADKSKSKHLGVDEQKDSEAPMIPGGPKSVQNFINDEFGK